MNRTVIAAALALAFATTAFAQDDTQTAPAMPAGDQSMPADSQPMNSDAMNSDSASRPAKPMRHRRMAAHNNANMALSGNEPKVVAYQNSSRMKSYPAVDHGHVPGDPPIIDHSGDQAPVTPTSTHITAPPTR